MTCVTKVREQSEKGEHDRKTLARIGKNYLAFANSDECEDYRMYCELAVELCERSQADGNRVYMSDLTAAKARINLFASHVYRQNQPYVDSKYKSVRRQAPGK